MIERVAQSVARVLKKIEQAAIRSGRSPEEIVLVAASKGVGIAQVREAAHSGVAVFGENRVREGVQKFFVEGQERFSVHFIGPLQTNKVRQVVGLFDLIHSIDSLHLAEKVHQEAEKRAIVQPVLIEVNLAGEISKQGVSVEALSRLVWEVGQLRHLSLQGLMVIPPVTPNAEGARPYFASLRRLGTQVGIHQFSMGMSSDFEVAIEEGAKWVRVGRAIFGERN